MRWLVADLEVAVDLGAADPGGVLEGAHILPDAGAAAGHRSSAWQTRGRRAGQGRAEGSEWGSCLWVGGFICLAKQNRTGFPSPACTSRQTKGTTLFRFSFAFTRSGQVRSLGHGQRFMLE